jgi:formate hydrogenlyase subunit 6/NADH:ubiquinone oxidoreductase subunit I
VPPRRSWTPDPSIYRYFPPGVSGNAVNGVGESARRRASPIFWHRPDREAFGRLQERVVERFNSVPAYRDVYANGDRGPRKPDPVAPVRRDRPAAEWTGAVKAFARSAEADLVGVARVDPLWVFDGYELAHPFVVVLGVTMDHARLSEVPSTAEHPDGQLEVADAYNRGARAAMRLANFVRAQGWDAHPHQGPWAGALNMIPAALACGFGELGKHGSIINRAYGSSFRLAAVTTDLPLLTDAPDAFGADDFCARCQVCRNACPPDAILDAKQLVRGVEKWYVDFDRCIPYFDASYGCGICIAVCPWSSPGRAPRLAERWSRRKAGSE